MLATMKSVLLRVGWSHLRIQKQSMSLKCDEISLWCDADSQDDKTSDKKARKKNGGISVRLRR